VPSLHVEILGEVQGVGFRWFVRNQARTLKLCGWVKNRSDGTVEVAAKGEAGALEALRAVLQSGPPGAHVKAVRDLNPIPEIEFPENFMIGH
jgi:acylphosphatase